MKGVWLEDRRLSLRADLPIPEPPPGEALVRVLRAGICNTDLELVKGYYPYRGIPGHEFVGVVERGPRPLEGARVVGEINAVCGQCRACLSGCRAHCDRRTVMGIAGRDGCFAEHLVLPAGNLHRVPADLSSDAAVFTEPLAAALEIQEQVRIGAGDRVLVAGDGKLGQLVARTLALTGCDLLAAGRHSSKLDLLEAAGIRTVEAGGVPKAEFDVVAECSGSPEGFALARRAVRPRGTIVLKSTYAGLLALDASSVVVDEITLVGSRCGPFEPALRLLAERKIDVEPLIHARYPLDRALEAFDHAARPGTLKVIVEP